MLRKKTRKRQGKRAAPSAPESQIVARRSIVDLLVSHTAATARGETCRALAAEEPRQSKACSHCDRVVRAKSLSYLILAVSTSNS
eukprot:3021848-Amphidinium_carterae.1